MADYFRFGVKEWCGLTPNSACEHADRVSRKNLCPDCQVVMSKSRPSAKQKPPFTIDCYYGEDGTPVVHIETRGIPENLRGPICRVYMNDSGRCLYANPHYRPRKQP